MDPLHRKAKRYFSRKISCDGVRLPGLPYPEDWQRLYPDVLEFAEPYLVYLDGKDYVETGVYLRLIEQLTRDFCRLKGVAPVDAKGTIFPALVARRMGYGHIRELQKNCKPMVKHWEKVDRLYAAWVERRKANAEREKRAATRSVANMPLKQYYFYHDRSLVECIEEVLRTYTDDILLSRQKRWNLSGRHFEGNDFKLVFARFHNRVIAAPEAKTARSSIELKNLIRGLFVWHHRRHFRPAEVFYYCGVIPQAYRSATVSNRLIGGFIPPEYEPKEDDHYIPDEYIDMDEEEGDDIGNRIDPNETE